MTVNIVGLHFPSFSHTQHKLIWLTTSVKKRQLKQNFAFSVFFNHLRSLGSWRELELIPAATERDGENPQQVASPSQS